MAPGITLTCTPLETSFRSMFYVYYHGMKQLCTNIILSIFSTYFVLKCATKSLKIGSQIKTLYPKYFPIGILNR